MLVTELQGIAQYLVLQGLLEASTAINYQSKALEHKQSFIQYLIENNCLSPLQIAQATAQHFDVPLLDLQTMDKASFPLHLVDKDLIQKHQMLPLFTKGNHLYLATEDPTKQVALKEIQFHTGLITHAMVVTADTLKQTLDKLLGAVNLLENTLNLNHLADSIPEEDSAIKTSHEEDPLIQYLNNILLEAIKQKASDIHFESYEHASRIRYRLDGILYEIAHPPEKVFSRISTRIKIMANLDIAEKRRPQDGGFKLSTSPSQSIDCRVSTCPTTFSEKIVIRILDSNTNKLAIDSLGFNAVQQAQFIDAISKSQGLILITGPTGSGKTLSLYTALNLLNTKEVNISTIEDPVEIKLPGVNQVNINPKAGLHFSTGLRSFLRQDPDIIMVGEIRDSETAEITLQAAQTGHLVLSTLHTNNAVETLNRLAQMGLPSFNIASSISLIIAQRLVRTLCNQCKVIRTDFTSTSLLEIGFQPADLEALILYKAKGCEHCTHGYKGRIGVFEVLPMTNDLGQKIMSGANALEILELAKTQGMTTIFESGLEKIKMGLTTIEEVNRVRAN